MRVLSYSANTASMASCEGDSARADAGAASNQPNTGGNANRAGAAVGSNLYDGHGGGIVRPREIENIVKRGRQLGESLVDENRLEPGDIDPLLASLEALMLDPHSASPQAHDLALRELMELEYRLRTENELPELPDLLVSEPGEVPDEYREMIADYFRNLSHE